ncbi:MAG TPA: glycosyltransferase family 2 protein [Polyangiaceae bacterium]|jgi:dolichol-phosphate mannosyltransferase
MMAEARTSAPPPSGGAESKDVPAPRERVGLSVVVPVYEELDNVVPLLDELEAALSGMPRSFEVVVVDDGSRDGTAELLRKLADEKSWLKVVFFRRNFGQTAAFDAGFRAASGDVVATIDGDLQNDPRDIPAMVAKLDAGFDMVAGWRRDRKDGVVLRKIPSRVANWIIRKATGAKVHDLGCSLRVYRREITEELRLYGEMHRFISVLADNMGARIAEVEVSHRARHAGTSKYGLKRTLKVLLDLITVIFLRRYQSKPIYVFGSLGLVMVFVSLVTAAIVLWEKFEYGVWVHRNPLFILSALAGLVGVQLLATGIVAELIIRTYFESQGKRAYSIAGRVGFDGERRP